MREPLFTDVLRLRIGPDTRAELNQLARRERLSASELVRRELRHITRQRQPETFGFRHSDHSQKAVAQ
jgi:hypothetical protein